MSRPLRDAVGALCKGSLGLLLDPTGMTTAGAGIDLILASLPDKTLKAKLKDLERIAFDHARQRLGDEVRVSDYTESTARILTSSRFKGARDLSAHGEDPVATTRSLLEQNAWLFTGEDESDEETVEVLVECYVVAYAALPEIETALAGLSRRRIEKLLGQTATEAETIRETSQAIHDLLARWARADVLTDPRWSATDLFLDPGAQPSSRWLEARFEIVPLRGRAPHLAALRAFRTADGDSDVLMVAGTGGLGKTRLLMEAVTDARRDGWHAGFVRSLADTDALRAGLDAYDATGKSLFLVIDYAEDRPRQVAAVVAWALREAVNPVRIVLLTRHEGLVTQAVERLGDHDDTIREVAYYLGGDRVLPLGADLGIPLDARPAFVAAAQAAFEPLMGRTPTVRAETLPASLFAADHFGVSVYLLAAALTSFDGPILTGKDDLATFLLRREWAYLSHVFRQTPHLQGAPLHGGGADCRDLFALATLTMAARPTLDGAPPFDALLGATTLGDALGAHPLTREALRDTLTGLYAAPNAPDGQPLLDALRPDPLGEGLVFTTLPERPALAAWALAPERDDATLESVCTVLLRTALAFAGDDCGPWLRGVLPDGALSDPRVVDTLQRTIHLQTTGFARLAVELAEAQVERCRHDEDGTDEALNRFAGALSWLGIRYSNAGRREDALKATEEAVAIRRALAERAPDAFRPDLAMSLNNLGNRYSDAGRREDALAATEEAAEIYRALAERAPDAFRPDLAMSLNNLGNRYSDAGRREDALKATEEAAEIYRALAERAPDAFRPDLATSLNNLGAMLSNAGRREDALKATEEAVAIRRALAERAPDAFRPDLAMSLNNLGNNYADAGRREDALKATEEAAEIYRALAERAPDAFRPDLAMSLNNLGAMLSNAGRREDALAATEEAVEIYRALAERAPDAFRPDLASSLNNLGNRYSDAGRREDALAATEEAVEIYRALAERAPDAFRPDLASSLNNLGNRYSDAGRREDALAATEEAVEIYRALAERAPDAFRPDLASSLNNLGTDYANAGRQEDALAATEEAAEIYRALAERAPDAFRPDLAMSLNNLGIRYANAGRREDALKATEEAVAIRRALAERAPDAFRPNLATSLGVLGSIHARFGAPDLAAAAFAEGVRTLRPLSQRYPAGLAGLFASLQSEYAGACEAAGLEPDPAVTAPLDSDRG